MFRLAVTFLAVLGLGGAVRADGLGDARRCSAPTIDHDSSIRVCTAAIRSEELSRRNLAITFYNRGIAYFGKGEYDRAIRDYDAAIGLVANEAEFYGNRAGAYRMKGMYAEAVLDYTRAIRLDPADAYAYFGRGFARFALGRREAAVEDFVTAYGLSPNDPRIRDTLIEMGLLAPGR